MSASRFNSRDKLIQVALEQFGKRGLDGVSTRDIAAAADMPMSQITYHFGGKEGLYLACAHFISEAIGRLIGPTLEGVDNELSVSPDALTARAAIKTILGEMVQAMTQNETAAFAQFITREQTEPTEAFSIIFSGVMGELFARIAHLVRLISLESMSEVEAKVCAITLMGQAMVFRVSHAAVLRSTGWKKIGDKEVGLIRATLLRNIDAICDGIEKGRAK